MAIERIAYRPAEAADALGVSRSRIYDWIKADPPLIRTIVVGTRLRIPAAELARISNEGVTPAAPGSTSPAAALEEGAQAR